MIVQFSIVPIGKGESLAELVAKVVDIVDQSGLPYKLTAMGTLVEGEWDDVFELIKECHLRMRQYSNRVMTSITIDDRAKAKGRIDEKVLEVEDVLGRKLKK